MTHKSEPVQKQLIKFKKGELVIFAIALVVMNILVAAWSCLDHTLPVYDIAMHLISGLNCRDLLAHPHLRSPAWWQSVMAGSYLYPPFVYLVYGGLKLVFGTDRWVDILAHAFFVTILFSSIAGLGKLIFKNASIGIFAALIIFCYPLVFFFAHCDMLDMPGLAMVSLTLFCFTWWQQSTSSFSAVVLGIVCALTILTKNNCSVFIVTPLLVSLFSVLFNRDWKRFKSFVLSGLVGLIILSPWLAYGAETMFKSIQDNIQVGYKINNSTDIFDFYNNVLYYVTSYRSLIPQYLLVLFLTAVFVSSKTTHRKMFYLVLSSLGGLLLLCLFHWKPSMRYVIPVVIVAVLYTSSTFVEFWHKRSARPWLCFLTALIFFYFIETNFTPYPLPRLNLPVEIKNFLGIPDPRQGQYYAPGGCCAYPMIRTDWGHNWVLQTIKPEITAPNLTLAVMSNTEEVSGATYAYLAKHDNLPLCVFSPRKWTLFGDDVSFDPNTAKLTTWYLLETKRSVTPASKFANKTSEQNYIDWCRYIRKSGQFKLIGTKPLPDGNGLELYQNISRDPINR